MADSMGGILTNGLGGDCTSMIIGPFRLKLVVDVVSPVSPPEPSPPIEPEVPPTVGGGGASLWQRLKWLEDNEPDETTPEQLRKVTLYVKFRKKTVKREYIVDKHRADKLVTLINSINGAANKITLSFRKSVTGRFISGTKARVSALFSRKVTGKINPTVTGKMNDKD